MSIAYSEVLNQFFGLNEFRRGQREIIDSVLAKKDVLAVLPTGGGKSLCYQFPAMFCQQLVVVVSPLIALMRDQVASLKRVGIPSGCLHSGQSLDEKRVVFDELRKSKGFVLYLSPERVQKPGFQAWIRQQNIVLFAVDEAHCISKWGHDFREEYGLLQILKQLCPQVPIIALTASATPTVLNDIARNLNLNNPDRHVHGFYRSNLYYQVENCGDDAMKLRYIRSAIEQTPEGRIIIYCGTRKNSHEICSELKKDFSHVGYYHAGLSSEKRTKIQEAYRIGKIRILAATNAFGMGVDQPDVRLVLHYQMPSNIDSLYQEMGRAGRDGEPSTCLLLYAAKDKGLQSYFIQSSTAPKAIKDSRWRTLQSLVHFAEGSECRHSEILTYYRDSQRIEKCGHCDVCDPYSTRRVYLKKESPLQSITEFVTEKMKLKVKKTKKADTELNEIEESRFQLLREWRRKKAKELDVAAFVVLSDRTLKELSREKPDSVESLHLVYGMGPVKVERYGNEVLDVLRV